MAHIHSHYPWKSECAFPKKEGHHRSNQLGLWYGGKPSYEEQINKFHIEFTIVCLWIFREQKSPLNKKNVHADLLSPVKWVGYAGLIIYLYCICVDLIFWNKLTNMLDFIFFLFRYKIVQLNNPGLPLCRPDLLKVLRLIDLMNCKYLFC